MDTLLSIFPYLIILLILLGLWSLYDHYQFTRFEGNLKRGVMIWTDPLAWQTRQFLDSLPASLQIERSFIRKEYNEVLIMEKQSFLKSFFSRRNRFPCIAYVDLSALEGRIEFRTSFSTLVSLTVGLMLFFAFAAALFSMGLPVTFPCFLLVIFPLISIGSFLFELYRLRRRLLNFLDQVMSQQKSGSNIGS